MGRRKKRNPSGGISIASRRLDDGGRERTPTDGDQASGSQSPSSHARPGAQTPFCRAPRDASRPSASLAKQRRLLSPSLCHPALVLASLRPPIVARDALCVARRAHNCRLPDPQPCPSGPRLAARRDIDAVIADLIAIHQAGDPQQRCSLASSPLPTLILALFGN